MKHFKFVSLTRDIPEGSELIDSDSISKGLHNIVVDGKLLLEKWQNSIEYIGGGLFISCLYDCHDSTSRLVDDNGNDLFSFPCIEIFCLDYGLIYEPDGSRHCDKDKMLFKVIRKSDRKENILRVDSTPLYNYWADLYQSDYNNGFRKILDNNQINFVSTVKGDLVSPVFFPKDDPPYKKKREHKKLYGEDYLGTIKHKGRWKALLKNGELH